MATKAKKTEEQLEAKRQQTHVPVSNVSKNEGGSYAIDHLELMDNHEAPDTNREPSEDIDERNAADLSFWNNSWTWAKAANSYGDKPQDAWFINPTAKLIGEVMEQAPLVHNGCEVALVAGDHKEELKSERARHVDFLRAAGEDNLISESLDMLTSYQSRFFEAVQRYIGLIASYKNTVERANVTEDDIEAADMRKHAAGAQCRAWTAKLIALVEAYHSVVTDERAYQLSYDFAPLPPESGKPASRAYSLYRWSVTTTLNKVGRRLARSIKDGKMDAEKYRIPRPWMTDERKTRQIDANDMIGDFN